jgi:hypothetical protein
LFFGTGFLFGAGAFGGGGLLTFLTIAGAFLGQALIAALAALTKLLYLAYSDFMTIL